MAVPFNIEGSSNGNRARVSRNGELIVSPLSHDDTSFQNMVLIDTAYNFYTPESGKEFIITSLIVFADKSISDTSPTIIEVYEASQPDTTTVDKTLLQFGMAKLSTLPIVPLRLKVNAGKYINAKTDDNNVLMTIMGYHVEKTDDI
jgi:hypothetical protein